MRTAVRPCKALPPETQILMIDGAKVVDNDGWHGMRKGVKDGHLHSADLVIFFSLAEIHFTIGHNKQKKTKNLISGKNKEHRD